MCGCADLRMCGCADACPDSAKRGDGCEWADVRMPARIPRSGETGADVRMANLNCSGSLVCNVSFLAESRRKRGDAEEITCVLCAPQRLREKEPDEI
jgi:hypothetical protein